MEIDQFIAERQRTWVRLDELTQRTRRRRSRLRPAEIDELLGLYETTSVHLSQARARYDDSALTDELSRRLGAARAVIYGARPGPKRPVSTFFAVVLPAAIHQTRRSIAVAALVTLVPAVGVGVWLTESASVREVAVDPATQRLLAERDFENYYSSNPAQAWVVELFTHNIEVTLLAFGLGALGGVGGLALLWQNAVSVGTTAAVMHAAGRGNVFWGLVLPHGLLELSAVFLGAGAGLAICWAVVAPGDRSRGEALRRTGTRSAVVMLGAMLCLVVSAVLEAFLTPSGLPTGARVGVGMGAWIALCWYGLAWGGRVTRRGASGTFDDLDR